MRTRSTTGNLQRGFTMLEVMVAIGVLAVLASVSVPAFQGFSANHAIRSASFDLTTHLLMARSEAVKRNGLVRVAQKDGSWSNGWTITDAATNTTLGAGRAMQSKVSVSGSPPGTVVFNADGRVVGAAALLQLGLEVGSSGNTLHRCIRLDPAGMPRVIKEACT
jgi:type IV fimbrial biogenesis protein FimT